MAGQLSFQLMDHDRETSIVGIRTGAVTGISLPGLLAEVGTLRGAIEGITLGVVAKESLSVFQTPLANVPPADENAQVERVWVVQFEDNLQFFDAPVNAIPNEGYKKKFTLTIPTADYEGNLITNTDEADLTDGGPVEAFVTAFEQTARSPYGGTVTVLKMTAAGRNR